MHDLLHDIGRQADSQPDQDLARDKALGLIDQAVKLARLGDGNYRLMLMTVAATCLVAVNAYDRKQAVVRQAIRRGPPSPGLIHPATDRP